jgi:glycosyltransferase involved in cell wall biosynthesis
MPGAAMPTVATRRVLIVTNIPTPYRLPLLNELADQLAAVGYRLKVAFAAAGYARRQWQVDLGSCRFELEILGQRGFTWGRGESPSFGYPGLLGLLARDRPAVTVVAGYSLATMKLWARSLVRATPYVIWSGAIASPAAPVAAWRRLQRRLLVARARGFVAYGSLARDYLVSLGAPAAQVSIGINTVDTAFFATETARLRGTTTEPDCLCIGDLTERKRPDQALRAFAAASHPGATVTFIGDGPQRPRLEALAAELGVGAAVRFAGFRQRAELPAYLARARCLLFPTSFDIWGLVLPEAMAAGVPCLASVHAGATRDLIHDGVTGFAHDFADTAAVAARIRLLLEQPAAAAAVGQAGRRHIEQQASLAVSAAGFVAAIRAAAAAQPQQ